MRCDRNSEPSRTLATQTKFIFATFGFPLGDGKVKINELRSRNFITGPYQTVTPTLPDGVVEDGLVRITLSNQPIALSPAVMPAVVEKPVAQLRAVRRKNKDTESDSDTYEK